MGNRQSIQLNQTTQPKESKISDIKSQITIASIPAIYENNHITHQLNQLNK